MPTANGMEDIADEPKTVKRKNRKEKKDKKKSRSGRSRSRLGGCGGRKQYRQVCPTTRETTKNCGPSPLPPRCR